jgi:hypothetical protein
MSISLLEGSQATPARLSGRNNMSEDVIVIGVASDRQRNFEFLIVLSIIW